MSSRTVSLASRARYAPLSPAAASSGAAPECLPQPGLELAAVLRGRDDDRHAAAPECLQQVADHPFGQFLIVTVELNDMITDVRVSGPNHSFLHLARHV